MKKTFEVKQLKEIPQSGNAAWDNYTYTHKEAEEVRPRPSEPTGVEPYTKGDSIHFTTLNRPIIQVLDNTLANDIRLTALLTNFKAIFGLDSFEFVSMSGSTVTVKRGAYVIPQLNQTSIYVNLKYEIYNGQKTELTDNLEIQYSVPVDGRYVFQFNDVGNIAINTENGEVSTYITIGFATFASGAWSNWEDARSFFGEADENDTDTIKNKLVSNYILNKIKTNEERLTVLETTDDPELRRDVNQLATDFYENGTLDLNALGGKKFETPVETQLAEMTTQLAVQTVAVNEMGQIVNNYEQDFLRLNDRIRQNELVDLKQQMEIDFLKSNPYAVPNIKTEGFFNINGKDVEIETTANELADINATSTDPLDPKAYRYRDYSSKMGLKEGFLTSQKKYYYGQIEDSWKIDFSTNLNGMVYDEDNDCFWAISNSFQQTSGDDGLIYQFKINDRGNLELVHWWKVWMNVKDAYVGKAGTTANSSFLGGITIYTENDVKKMAMAINIVGNSSFNTIDGEIYSIAMNSIDMNSNKMAVDAEGLIADNEYINGLTFDGTYLVYLRLEAGTPNSVKLVILDGTPTEIDLSGMLPNIKKDVAWAGPAVVPPSFNLTYNNGILYISDYDDVNDVNLYSINYSLISTPRQMFKNIIGFNGLRCGGLAFKNNDLYCINTSDFYNPANMYLEKRKIKNTYMATGQIPNILFLDKSSFVAEGFIGCEYYNGYLWAIKTTSTPKKLYKFNATTGAVDGAEVNLDSALNVKTISTFKINKTNGIMYVGERATAPTTYSPLVWKINISAAPGTAIPVIRSKAPAPYNLNGIAISSDGLYLYLAFNNKASGNWGISKVQIPAEPTTIDLADGTSLFINYEFKTAQGGVYGLEIDSNNKNLYLTCISNDNAAPTTFYGTTIYQINLEKDYSSDPEPLIMRKFNIWGPKNKGTNYSINKYGRFWSGLTIISNQLYVFNPYFGFLAKILDTTSSISNDEMRYFSFNTYPVALSNKVHAVEQPGQKTLSYGERYYDISEYKSPNCILPQKFIAVTNQDNGGLIQTGPSAPESSIDIIDVTNANNPFKFMSFYCDRSLNQSALSKEGTYSFKPTAVKVFKDVVYILGVFINVSHTKTSMIIIDFKSDEIMKLEGYSSASDVKLYRYELGIEDRNNKLNLSTAWTLVKTFAPIYASFAIPNYSFDVNEIDGEIYVVIGSGDYDSTGHMIFSIYNSTKQIFSTFFRDASATSNTVSGIKIADNGYVYSTIRQWGGAFASDGFSFGPINLVNISVPTEAASLLNYKTISLSEGAYGCGSSIDVATEYDVNGYFKSNKVFLGTGNGAATGQYPGIFIYDDKTSSYKTVFSANSNVSATYFYLSNKEDILFSSLVTNNDSGFTFRAGMSLYKMKNGRTVEKDFISNNSFPYGLYTQRNSTLANGYQINLGASKIDANPNTVFFDSHPNDTASPLKNAYALYNHNIFVQESIFESKEIDMSGDEKRLIFTMSENKEKGQRQYVLTNLPAATGIFEWSSTTGDIYDELGDNATPKIYFSSSIGARIIEAFPVGTTKVDLILRFGPTEGRISVGVDNEDEFTIDLADTTISEQRRILTVAEGLDPEASHAVRITVVSGTCYFNGFAYYKEISNSQNVSVQFSVDYDSSNPENATWLSVDEENELEFLGSETFTSGNSFSIASPNIGAKRVYSNGIIKTEGLDWTQEVVDGVTVVSTTETLSNVRIDFFIKPIKGKLRITIKQPTDTDNWYDKFAETYISDFGLYFGS